MSLSKHGTCANETEVEAFVASSDGGDLESAGAASRPLLDQKRMRWSAVVAIVGAVALIGTYVATRRVEPEPPRATSAWIARSLKTESTEKTIFTNKTGVVPAEVKGDKNPCDSFTEEPHDGLCYRKCSLLTKGKEPLRASAFTCCKDKSCELDVLKMDAASMEPCHGYDVAGDGVSCPHAFGVCLKDEELSLGDCYEKCATLTKGKYPYRMTALTCCNSKSKLNCLNPFNDYTSASLNVGGGKGDHDKDTPRKSHPPLKEATESKLEYKSS